MCHLIVKSQLADAIRAFRGTEKACILFFFIHILLQLFICCFSSCWAHLKLWNCPCVSLCLWLCVRAAGDTHPQQHSGVEPAVHQEGHVEVDEEEGVDPQPHQLQRQICHVRHSQGSEKIYPIFYFFAFTIIKDTEHHNLTKRLNQ